MNKEKLAVLAAIAMSFTTMPALAQEAGGGHAGNVPTIGQGQAQEQDAGQGQELSPQKFEALKLIMLSRIKQKEACVEAAADPQALRDCMMPGGGAGGGEGGGAMMHNGRPMPKGSMGDVNPGGPMIRGGGYDGAAPPPPQGNGQ